jgi:hypothetical protein
MNVNLNEKFFKKIDTKLMIFLHSKLSGNGDRGRKREINKDSSQGTN